MGKEEGGISSGLECDRRPEVLWHELKRLAVLLDRFKADFRRLELFRHAFKRLAFLSDRIQGLFYCGYFSHFRFSYYLRLFVERGLDLVLEIFRNQFKRVRVLLHGGNADRLCHQPFGDIPQRVAVYLRRN